MPCFNLTPNKNGGESCSAVVNEFGDVEFSLNCYGSSASLIVSSISVEALRNLAQAIEDNTEKE